jgi:hypothetical protein
MGNFTPVADRRVPFKRPYTRPSRWGGRMDAHKKAALLIGRGQHASFTFFVAGLRLGSEIRVRDRGRLDAP